MGAGNQDFWDRRCVSHRIRRWRRNRCDAWSAEGMVPVCYPRIRGESAAGWMAQGRPLAKSMPVSVGLGRCLIGV